MKCAVNNMFWSAVGICYRFGCLESFDIEPYEQYMWRKTHGSRLLIERFAKDALAPVRFVCERARDVSDMTHALCRPAMLDTLRSENSRLREDVLESKMRRVP